MKEKLRKIIKETLEEEVVNNGSKTSTRLVEVDYSGKKMKAIAIGFASGPFYKEVYYLLDDIQYEANDFENIKGIDGYDLIN